MREGLRLGDRDLGEIEFHDSPGFDRLFADRIFDKTEQPGQ